MPTPPSDEAIDLARGSWLASLTAASRRAGFTPPTLPTREEFIASTAGSLLARDMQNLLDGKTPTYVDRSPEEPF